MLTERVRRVLAHIEELDRRQQAGAGGIPFWRVSADTGMLLHILVRACGARRAVEVGTSSGYSGIYIASALQETDGHLWTLDVEPSKVALAREHFARAGLSARVTQLEGDALRTLPALVAASYAPIDFAFLDAEKPDYIRYFEAIRPRLRRGSVVCADNVARHADAVRDYLAAVRAEPFVTAVVPTQNAEGERDAIAVSLWE